MGRARGNVALGTFLFYFGGAHFASHTALASPALLCESAPISQAREAAWGWQGARRRQKLIAREPACRAVSFSHCPPTALAEHCEEEATAMCPLVPASQSQSVTINKPRELLPA